MEQLEIAKYGPCREAMEYRATYKTFREAWDQCPRGDWMLWIAVRLGVDMRTVTLAKALCAKTVLHLMSDERSRKAVEVAEAYGRGNASYDELKDAAAGAASAYDVAARTGAAVAYSAYSAATDNISAASAAADGVLYAAVADDAHTKSNKDRADICRTILTDEVFSKL